MTSFQFTPSYLEERTTEDLMELTPGPNSRGLPEEDLDIDLELTDDAHEEQEDEFMGENINVLTSKKADDEFHVYAGNEDEMIDEGYTDKSDAETPSTYEGDLQDAEYAALNIDNDLVVGPTLVEKHDQFEELSQSRDGTITAYHDDQNHHQVSDPQPRSYDEIYAKQPGFSAFNAEKLLKCNESELKTEQLVNQRVEKPSGSEELDHVRSWNVIDSLEADAARSNAVTSEETRGAEELINFSNEYTAQLELDSEPQQSEGEPAQDESPLSRLTHVHPIVVVYQGTEMSLFPPTGQNEEHSQQYLLSDDQLASDSIKALLGACRSVLADSISEQDELIFEINGLNLYINESNPECSDITLIDLVELYVHLQHHDRVENPPPLFMTLTSNLRLSYRLDCLRNAVIDGKGLSQLQTLDAAEDGQYIDSINGKIDPDLKIQHHLIRSSEECEIDVLEQSRPARIEDEYESQSGALPSKNPPQNHHDPKTNVEHYLNPAPYDKDVGNAGITYVVNEREYSIDAERDKKSSVDEEEEARILPASSSTVSSKVDHPGKLDVDNEEDCIDYDDDVDLNHRVSSRSSTLQNDVLSFSNQDEIDQEHRSRHTNTSKFDISATDISQSVEDEIVHKLVNENDKGDWTDIHERHQRILESDLQYSEYANGGSIRSPKEMDGKLTDPENENDLLSHKPDFAESTDPGQSQSQTVFEDKLAAYQLEKPAILMKANETGSRQSRRNSTQLELEQVVPSRMTANELNDGSQHNKTTGMMTNNQDSQDSVLAGITESSIHDNTNDLGDNPVDPKHIQSDIVNQTLQGQDEDEITYEDEDEGEGDKTPKTTLESLLATPNIPASPGSLKRAYSLDDDYDAQQDGFQDTKRVRSR